MNFNFLHEPWFWVVFSAASELIGMNKKLRQNSVIELLLGVAGKLKPLNMKGGKGNE